MGHPIVLTLSLALASAAPASWLVDPSRSEVVFLMSTTWHGVTGRTSSVKGLVESETEDLFTDGVVEIEVRADDLDTGNKRRDRKMKDTHLETGEHPTIAFRSTAPPRPSGSSPGAPFDLEGRLTIHGVERDVTLRLSAEPEDEGWRVTGEHTVRLSDYGIEDPSIFLNRVQDEVIVSLSILMIPEPPGAD